MITTEQEYADNVARLITAVKLWAVYYHGYTNTPTQNVQQRDRYKQSVKSWRLRVFRIGQYLQATEGGFSPMPTLEERVAALEAQARSDQSDYRILKIEELKTNVAMLEDVMDNYEAQCADDARRIAELEGVVNALMRQNEKLGAAAGVAAVAKVECDTLVKRVIDAYMMNGGGESLRSACRALSQRYMGLGD